MSNIWFGQAGGVTLSQHGDSDPSFPGWQESFGEGTFLGNTDFPNDDASHIAIDDGFTATLREHGPSDERYPGNEYTYTGPTSMNLDNFNDELKSFPLKKTNPKDFYFHNGSLMSGDSEYLYNIIRSLKPKNIIEIGSGHSTKMMLNGINKNYEEDNIKCELTCIEPYEEDLLKGLNINLIKERVEKVDIELFNQLDKNDILFIDSSHIIRPQGDVLFEFNEILPSLKPGVLVHIHDIFSPKDYLDEWILDKHIMWN